MKFPGKVRNGPVNKCLNFGGDPDTDPDPYRGTAETCLGGAMHCPGLFQVSFRLSRHTRNSLTSDAQSVVMHT